MALTLNFCNSNMIEPFIRLLVEPLTSTVLQLFTDTCSRLQTLFSHLLAMADRFLPDAVEQFGLPDAFITISPFEWSFPFAKRLSDIRQCTGMGPMQLSGYKTYNITHVLEQMVRGYLCGSTSQKWSEHVFSYNKIANYPNIKTFFYHFEFHEMGTVHLHMLVWLKDMRRTHHQFFRADIQGSHPDLVV